MFIWTQWTQTVNGLGGSSVKMACPSTMISGNHFNGTEHALYFGQGFQEFIANNFSDDVRTDVVKLLHKSMLLITILEQVVLVKTKTCRIDHCIQ